MANICEHCNREFSNIYNLKHHKKTAKYCLDKKNEEIEKNFICGCTKSFNTKSSLERHNLTCVISKIVRELKEENLELKEEILNLRTSDKIYQIQIKELKEQIEKLQDKLENVAIKAVSRPTTTNNTTNNTQINNFIQQMDIVTEQLFEEQLEHFNINYIIKGAPGFADYANEHPLHNRIVCVDINRKKFKFKNSNGDLITDPEMLTLSTKFFSTIKNKNKDLIMNYVQEMQNVITDPEKKMQLYSDMMEYMFFVNRGAEGEKHALYDDFIKCMCSHATTNLNNGTIV